MLGCCLLIVALAVFLPYLALSQAAFTRAWGQGLSLANFSLANFHYILFEHHTARQSVINSFIYATWTACLAVSLAVAIAYIVNRRLLPFARVLGFLCMAPFVIPGIVLAIGFYAAYDAGDHERRHAQEAEPAGERPQPPVDNQIARAHH